MKKLMAVLMVALLAGCGAKDSTPTAIEGTINVYTRDATSGTREAYEKAGDFVGLLSKKATEVASNGDMATKVGGDVKGIGYVSLSTDFKANKVTALKFEGVTPSEEKVLDGSYKLQRPFDFTTRATKDFGSDDKEQLVLAFLDYLQNSTEGMQVVEKAGGVVDNNKSTPWDELKKNHPIVEKDNSSITIRTGGSTSVEKTIKAALESFQPMAGSYKFTMNQTGSGDGWKRVLGSEKDGASGADIGFASRNFKDGEEDITKAAKSGTYCVDAVVSIVNETNKNIKNITAAQIKDIYTGKLEKWEDIK